VDEEVTWLEPDPFESLPKERVFQVKFIARDGLRQPDIAEIVTRKILSMPKEEVGGRTGFSRLISPRNDLEKEQPTPDTCVYTVEVTSDPINTEFLK
jgi:hypothetical protein